MRAKCWSLSLITHEHCSIDTDIIILSVRGVGVNDHISLIISKIQPPLRLSLQYGPLKLNEISENIWNNHMDKGIILLGLVKNILQQGCTLAVARLHMRPSFCPRECRLRRHSRWCECQFDGNTYCAKLIYFQTPKEMRSRLRRSHLRSVMFKLNIACECHFASASVALDDGRACATVDLGLRCTPAAALNNTQIQQST